MTDILLQVEGLDAGYGDVQVLWGISLKVKRGTMTTLLRGAAGNSPVVFAQLRLDHKRAER